MWDLCNSGFMSESLYNWFACNTNDHRLYDKKYEEYMQAVRKHYWNTRFHVIPIGLTYEQVLKYNPPSNPAKLDDPRAAWYVSKYGTKSWEVDALNPDVMVNLITSAIESHIDMDIYQLQIEQETIDKLRLRSFIQSLNQ